MTVGDLVTEEQFKMCVEIGKNNPTHQVAKKISEEIIEPNIDKINEITGQENDPKYIAYAILNILLTEKLI